MQSKVWLALSSKILLIWQVIATHPILGFPREHEGPGVLVLL